MEDYNVDRIKKQIAEAIEEKLQGTWKGYNNLSCEDLQHLAQAVSEPERNDIFKAMSSFCMVSADDVIAEQGGIF